MKLPSRRLPDGRTSYRVPLSACPWCGRPHNGAASDQERQPAAGDLVVCGYCAEVSEFEAGLGRRKVTEFELQAMDAKSPGLLDTVRACQRARGGLAT